MSYVIVIFGGLMLFAFARSMKSLLLVSAVLVGIVGVDLIWPDTLSRCTTHSMQCVAASFSGSARQTSSFLEWIFQQAGLG
ncbi:hypothetical protein [Devosia sp.]|uniref:hypothetical protein n=1 Tax=Devosia sp. TaxID=1871048 RepID=UPI003A8E3065